MICQFLCEMNSDVRGDWVAESVDALLVKNPSFFASFSVVVAANLAESLLLLLAAALWAAGVPLLVVRSYGMIGYIRLVTAEHTGGSGKKLWKVHGRCPVYLRFVCHADLFFGCEWLVINGQWLRRIRTTLCRTCAFVSRGLS